MHCRCLSSLALHFARPRQLPALLGAAALLAGLCSPSEGSEIIVPNSTASSITVYDQGDSGDVAPLRTIAGAATQINTGFAVAVDEATAEIYVSSFSSREILVFAPGADGDVSPSRMIGGTATQLVLPIGIEVDPVHGELFVRNLVAGDSANAIVVFALSASGNAAPLRMLGGADTGILTNAVDLAVDPVRNELFVVSRDIAGSASSIRVFSRTATGNALPLRQIEGAATLLDEPYGIVLDPAHGELAVTEGVRQSVLVFALTASGDAAPLREIVPSPSFSAPAGIDVDPWHNELFVASQAGEVAVFDRRASGSTTRLRSLTGASTGLASPSILSLSSHPLFADGFETGDTSVWSAAVP